ncbi:RNA ligase [Streptomyces sp. BI20]|uniref:RNA ligase n=1 Tax=Streptomyces sp. BI20 TaxID=3403460 RepID=UPI003C718F0A
MSQASLTLHDLMPREELAEALSAGHITRRAHPTLPLSLYSYTRGAQYEQLWNAATTRCRGLVVEDASERVVALPLPKFFNVSEHESGRPYAAALPEEPFEIQEKVDGSLAVVFHYDGRWHAASKGSFTSTQATWAGRHLRRADTTRLVPGVTYLAEILYPENRIVVNYGERRDLVLLAALRLDGTELPLSEAAEHWTGVGSAVTVHPPMPLSDLVKLTETNTHPDGTGATGTDAEGYVLRYASGLRVKAKIAEYVRLHKTLTGVTVRDIWRAHGIERFAHLPEGRVAQNLGCPLSEVRAHGGRPLRALLGGVPDEYDAWVRGVVEGVDAAFADRIAAAEAAHAGLAHLAGDRGAFAREAARTVADREVRAWTFLLLDGKDISLPVYRAVRPTALDPFSTDEEN